MWFSDNPKCVYLDKLHFRLKERFFYKYNFHDQWQHDIRFEKCIPLDPKKTYSICIGGARKAPPENCGGPWSYMALKQKYSPWYIERQFLKII